MDKKINTLTVPIKTIFLVMACFMVLAGGVAGMTQMSKAKKVPASQKVKKTQLSVTTLPVVKEAVAILVTGYGQANPVYITEISPQVSGKIIQKTALKQGEIVQKEAILLKIDAIDYENKLEKALNQVEFQKNQVEQLKLSYDRDKGRLGAIKKNTGLAQASFSRLTSLYKKDRVGTLSSVEEAEQNYNSLLDTEKNLIKAIDLYPLQVVETKSNLADAISDLKIAQLDVERCVIRAPFTGRIKEISFETGAYITMGTTVLTLANDSILEIQVPLSDKDAFERLGLNISQANASLNLKEIDCRVESITGNVSTNLPGFVHRIIKYDAESRTIFLAVRVLSDGLDSMSIPLMEGMFCKTFLKGNPIKDLVKVPASILNPDNTLYIVRENKLKTLDVAKVMEEKNHIYLRGFFLPTDRIITTKLINPIENTWVKVTTQDSSPEALAVAGSMGDPR